MSYRLTPAAEADVEQIADRIALENPSAAMNLIDTLHRRWELLAAYPFSGRRATTSDLVSAASSSATISVFIASSETVSK
jgi:plasmid stabilization system protein ParE